MDVRTDTYSCNQPMNRRPDGRVHPTPPTPRAPPPPTTSPQPLAWGGGVNTRPFGRLFMGWLYEQTSVRTSNCTGVVHLMSKWTSVHTTTSRTGVRMDVCSPHPTTPRVPPPLATPLGEGGGEHTSIWTLVHGGVL